MYTYMCLYLHKNMYRYVYVYVRLKTYTSRKYWRFGGFRLFFSILKVIYYIDICICIILICIYRYITDIYKDFYIHIYLYKYTHSNKKFYSRVVYLPYCGFGFYMLSRRDLRIQLSLNLES
jgi:hypothetical protein